MLIDDLVGAADGDFVWYPWEDPRRADLNQR
jgi:hypothetical protein